MVTPFVREEKRFIKARTEVHARVLCSVDGVDFILGNLGGGFLEGFVGFCFLGFELGLVLWFLGVDIGVLMGFYGELEGYTPQRGCYMLQNVCS